MVEKLQQTCLQNPTIPNNRQRVFWLVNLAGVGNCNISSTLACLGLMCSVLHSGTGKGRPGEADGEASLLESLEQRV